MNGKKEKRKGLRRAAAIAAIAMLGVFLFGGCREEADSPAGSELVSSSPEATAAALSTIGDGIDLTMDEIDDALDLTDEQAAALAPVMAEWAEAAAERQAERESRRAEREERRGRRGLHARMHGEGGAPPQRAPEGDPPILTLLEGSREVLDGEQYVGLLEILAGKHEAVRSERRAARGEREGRKPGPGHFGRGGDGHLLEMAEALGLTDEQLEALDALHESTRERMEALRESGDREANREAMRAIHEESRAAMEEILTEEQLATLEELREERREERRERAEERSAERIERRAEWLARALGLDDGQQAGVEAVLESAHESARALRESARENGDREGLREEMQSIHEEAAASIRALLTEEQAAAFDALAELLPGHGGPGGHHGPPHR